MWGNTAERGALMWGNTADRGALLWQFSHRNRLIGEYITCVEKEQEL